MTGIIKVSRAPLIIALTEYSPVKMEEYKPRVVSMEVAPPMAIAE